MSRFSRIGLSLTITAIGLAGDPPVSPAKEAGGSASPPSVFDRLDRNHDGKVTADEASPAMRDVLRRLDADRDGTLTREEFRQASERAKRLPDPSSGTSFGPPPGGFPPPGGMPPGPMGPGAFRGTAPRPNSTSATKDSPFDRWDRNRDGKLEGDEIPASLDLLVRAADRDGNGVITRREMQAALDAVEPAPEEMMEIMERQAEADARMRKAMEDMSNRMNASPDMAGPPDRRRPGQPPRPGVPAGPGMAQATNMFRQLDRNGDEKLTRDELAGPAAQRLARADRDGDGTITKAEFEQALALMQRFAGAAQAAPVDPNDPIAMFDRCDANADGRVSKAESKGVLKENFDRIDTDRSGKLSLEEIRAAYPEPADDPNV
jgi:Ca2+-binding EF-hand superfamily protein